MTNNEKITRDIHLTFDFVNYLIDNPEKIEELPDKSVIEFVENNAPAITKPSQSDVYIEKKIVRVRNSFEITE